MLHTLGGLHLEGAVRQQAGPLVLLSYLTLEGSQERRSVQGLFFPGHDDPAGRLRMLLHRLKGMADDAVQLVGSRLHSTVPCDAAELLKAAEHGQAAQVLALYQGRFLDGVRLPGGQELEEWVFATRERLAARVRACHLDLARDALAAHSLGPVLGHAERAYLLPGAPEPGADEARTLALLLTAAGSAFAADARAEARMSGEPALPDDAVSARAAVLGVGGAALGGTALVGTVQALPAAGPAAGPEPTLPALLGREPALAALDAVLARGARLVTLLGPGGIGKTLLARHALARLRAAAPNSGLLPGVLVDLSSVHDASAVLPAIAGAVQARTAGLDDVAQAARGFELLLLDNFEQVLPAAPHIGALLDAAPGLRLLVTSRERLHLRQEHVLPLDGLALEAEGATPGEWSDAARLFVRRATRAHLGFVPDGHRAGIEAVCGLLRGVPLLIELASAWVRTLSPAQIAAHLDMGRLRGADLSAPDLGLLESRDRDVPARHASARAVLEASWQRLDAHDQQQLGRLAVFLSDFTLHAARQVCGTTLSDVAALSDKSWLGQSGGGQSWVGAAGGLGGGRLSWHPLARAFVREMTDRAPDTWRELLPAHAQFFAQGLSTARFQGEGLGEVLSEWADIAQAIRTLAQRPADWPTLIRLAREVPIWADQAGNYASVASLIGRVLDALPDQADTGADPTGPGTLNSLRAQLLRARAFMRVRMHLLTSAGDDYRRAADLLMQSRDEDEVLQGLNALAVLHHQAGEHAQAQDLWLDILARVERLAPTHPGMVKRQAYTLQFLAMNAWVAGELAAAERWIRDAIRVEQRLAPRVNRVLAYGALGLTLTRLGRRAEAQLALTDGLKLARELGAGQEIPKLLNFLAINLLELGRPEEGVQLCLEALELDQLAQPLVRTDMLDTLALCYSRSGDDVQARHALAQSVHLCTQMQDVPNLLHRLCTFVVISGAVLDGAEQATVLHWLLGHEQANAELRERALRALPPDTLPTRTLPPLDPAVISPEAQRLCGYSAV